MSTEKYEKTEVINYTQLLVKLSFPDIAKLYITKDNLVYSYLKYIDPTTVGNMFTSQLWNLSQELLIKFIPYNTWFHVPITIINNLEHKANILPFTILYDKLPVFVKFTHYVKGNCRKYFKGTDENIYCQYKNKSNYHICSKDGEPYHIINNIKEINNG
jgi:hypothetical protein